MSRRFDFHERMDRWGSNLGESLWPASYAVLLFALWSLWLSVSYFGLGSLSFVFVHDTGDSWLPFRISLSSAVSHDRWGYWDAQTVAGIDRLAMQVWPFQPDVVLFSILPGWLAYGLITFLQRFVAGFFTFCLLAEVAGLPAVPSLYAGLFYAAYVQAGMNANISGFSLDNGFLTEAGLPFVLWGLSRLNAYSIRSYIYAVLIGLFFALTAWFPNAVYLLPMVFFWFILVPPKSGKRYMLIPLVFTAAWLIASLPLVMALAANVPLSHRAAWPGPMGPWGSNFQVMLEYVYGRIGLVWRIILDNAWPLGLAMVGLGFSRLRDGRLVALLAAAMLCLAFQPVYGPIHELLHRYWSFLKAANFNRVYLLVPFLFALAAAFGLSHIPSRISVSSVFAKFGDRELHIRTWLVTAAVIWLLGQTCVIQARNMYHALQGANFRELYLHPEVERLSRETEHSPPFRVATVAEALRPPASLWAQGFETADGYVNVYPKRYQEFWERVISPLVLSDQQIFKFFHYWGNKVYLFSPSYFSPFPRVYGSRSPALHVKDYYNLGLLSLANVRFIVSPMRLADEGLSELPRSESSDLIGFQHQGIFSKFISFVTGKKPLAPLYVYENRLFLPRFLPMRNVRLFDHSPDLLSALATADHDVLQSTAFLKRSDVAHLPLDGLSPAPAEVTLVSYLPDEIVLEASCVSDFVLIVTNNYSPYWKALIDGKATSIFPADHTFQGLFVRKGRHKIALRYEPPYALSLKP